MAHKPVTQSRPIPMPRHTGLLVRKGRFYLNVRVPTELRQTYGKRDIFRKSLGTSDYREAVSKVRFEVYKLDAEFAEKRREMQDAKRASAPPPAVCELSERDAYQIVLRFFVGLEKLSHEWWENDGCRFGGDDLANSIDNLRVEQAAYAGGTRWVEANDGHTALDSFLRSEGLNVPQDSAAYAKLRVLFRLALKENTERTLDRAESRIPRPREPIFRDVSAFTQTQPARPIVTLNEMLTRFSKWLVDAGRAQGTHRTYDIPARILREIIGERTAVDAITKDDMERLFALLSRAPANAAQRYRGFTIAQAVEEADKRGDKHRLGGKTLANYFNNIVAVFNFAVEKGMISVNPAKDRYLRATFERDVEEAEKAVFSIEELNRLFQAPIYTGCKDDENGYATPGKAQPRRGRFWLPLISLFHGLRCNEAAQLYVEDVCEADGIPYFEIREERADGKKCDKRLKTRQSKRRVPIHSEIIRIGFLAFVAERRRDPSHARLFPDLPLGASGYFSNPFSKWFGRFIKATLGEKCDATFHSFRHLFRDALTEAGVPIPDVERLGGWELMARSAERDYGKGPSLRRLREQMDKTKYRDLDLAHLYPVQPVAPHAARMRLRGGAAR